MPSAEIPVSVSKRRHKAISNVCTHEEFKNTLNYYFDEGWSLIQLVSNEKREWLAVLERYE